jgi:hypothetical protein
MLVASIGIAAAVYALLSLALGLITKEDIKR